MKSGKREQRARRAFSKEFQRETVALVRSSGNPVSQVARDLDLTESVLRRWIKQADIDDGRRDGVTTEESQELSRLRKEVRVLREERDILKRATVFFAKETR